MAGRGQNSYARAEEFAQFMSELANEIPAGKADDVSVGLSPANSSDDSTNNDESLAAISPAMMEVELQRAQKEFHQGRAKLRGSETSASAGIGLARPEARLHLPGGAGVDSPLNFTSQIAGSPSTKEKADKMVPVKAGKFLAAGKMRTDGADKALLSTVDDSKIGKHLHELLTQGKEAAQSQKAKAELSQEFEELAAKIQKSKTQGVELNHTVELSDDLQRRALQQRLAPLLKVLAEGGIKVGKISIEQPTQEKGAAGDDSKDRAQSVAGTPTPKAQKPGLADDKAGGEKSFQKQTSAGEAPHAQEARGKRGKSDFADTLSGRQFMQLQASGKEGVGPGSAPNAASTANPSGSAGPEPKVFASTADEIAQKIAAFADQRVHVGNNKLAVEVQVENIGRVAVDAVRHMERINIEVQVDSLQMRRLLESQLRPLLEQFAKDGLDIGKLDVSVRDQRSDGQPHQELSQDARRQSLQFRDSGPDGGPKEQRRRTQEVIQAHLIRRQTGLYQSLEIWA